MDCSAIVSGANRDSIDEFVDRRPKLSRHARKAWYVEALWCPGCWHRRLAGGGPYFFGMSSQTLTLKTPNACGCRNIPHERWFANSL